MTKYEKEELVIDLIVRLIILIAIIGVIFLISLLTGLGFGAMIIGAIIFSPIIYAIISS